MYLISIMFLIILIIIVSCACILNISLVSIRFYSANALTEFSLLVTLCIHTIILIINKIGVNGYHKCSKYRMLDVGINVRPTYVTIFVANI